MNKRQYKKFKKKNFYKTFVRYEISKAENIILRIMSDFTFGITFSDPYFDSVRDQLNMIKNDCSYGSFPMFSYKFINSINETIRKNSLCGKEYMRCE